MLGLRTFFDAAADPAWSALYEGGLGRDRFTVRVEEGRTAETRRGQPYDGADATIETDPATLRAARSRRRRCRRYGRLAITATVRRPAACCRPREPSRRAKRAVDRRPGERRAAGQTNHRAEGRSSRHAAPKERSRRTAEEQERSRRPADPSASVQDRRAPPVRRRPGQVRSGPQRGRRPSGTGCGQVCRGPLPRRARPAAAPPRTRPGSRGCTPRRPPESRP